MADADPLPRDHLVTSSEFVRRFGAWQEQAQRAPVYIVHRGRPRFMLASIELMETLCAPRAGGGDAALAAILDGGEAMVVLADPAGRVTAASGAARRHFADRVALGAMLADLADAPSRPILAAAVARSVATGIADRIDCPSAAFPDRRLALALQPYAGGIAVFASDASAAAELRTAQAAAESIEQAAAAAGAVVARINLRGYCDRPDAPLARLLGLEIEALASVRFATLVEIASRVAVADAIEAVIADGRPRGIAAALLVNRAAPRPVRIGLATRRSDVAIEGVTALIVPAAGG